MYEFDYHKAKNVKDAVAIAKKQDEAKYLAGGMSLVPPMKLRLAKPGNLIDLNEVGELAGIKVDGKTVAVGAMTRHESVAESKDVKKAIPALAKLAGGIGDPQVRHRGTIGGSLANSDPAACYPTAVLGLGATIETDQRKIAADDFFTGLFETALKEGELITKVVFPVPDKACYIKFPNPASRFSIVGVFVSKKGNEVRCVVTGAGPCVFRVKGIEDALKKDFSPKAIENYKHPASGLNSDIHGSAEYRAHLITVLAKRAVAGAE